MQSIDLRPVFHSTNQYARWVSSDGESAIPSSSASAIVQYTTPFYASGITGTNAIATLGYMGDLHAYVYSSNFPSFNLSLVVRLRLFRFVLCCAGFH